MINGSKTDHGSQRSLTNPPEFPTALLKHLPTIKPPSLPKHLIIAPPKIPQQIERTS